MDKEQFILLLQHLAGDIDKALEIMADGGRYPAGTLLKTGALLGVTAGRIQGALVLLGHTKKTKEKT